MLRFPWPDGRLLSWRVLVASLVVCLGGALCGPVRAQQPEPEGAAPADLAPELTVEGLQARIGQLEGAKDLEDATRQQLKETYEAALAQVRLAIERAASIAQFKQDRAEAPELLQEIRSELDQLPAEPKPEVPDGASLQEMEQRLAQSEADLAEAKKNASELDARLKRRAERRAAMPQQVAEAKQRLNGVAQELGTAPSAEEPRAMALAKRVLLQARHSAVEKEIELYNEELLYYEATRDLLLARRDRAAREVSRGEKLVTAWQQIVNQGRRAEAEKAAQKAQQARREAAQAHPAVRELAEGNAQLAERRTGPDGLAARIERVSAQLKALNEKREELEQQFEAVEKKVGAVGLTKAVGLLLQRRRAELPDVRAHRRSIRLRQSEIAQAQFELIELEEQGSQLADIEKQVKDILGKLAPSVSDSQRQDIEAETTKLLQARRQYVNALGGDYDSYFGNLVELDSSERQLVVLVGLYARYIDKQILWVQSTSPVQIATLLEAWQALRWLAAPAGWAAVAQLLWVDVRTSPALFGTAILFVGILLSRRRRLYNQLRGISKLVHHARSDRFFHTVRASVLTLLLALPWPAALMFLGWRLGAFTDAPDLAYAASAGLWAVAVVFLVLQLLRCICVPGGLADDHFRMRSEALEVLRRHLRWFGALLLPLVFVTAMAAWQSGEAAEESLSRLSFMAGLGALAALLLIVLRPTGQLMKPTLERSRGGWLDHSRYVWYPAAVAFPVVVALIAALGYYYTAQQLEGKLQATILLLLCVTFLNALMVRWLMVVRRRLAIRKSRARRAAAETGEKAEEGLAGPEAGPALPAEPEESLYALSVQTRRFLRAFLALAVVLGLWLIWANVLPALAILERVELWDSIDRATGQPTPVTLSNLALAAIVVLVAVVAARNVPGLLEIAILQHLPLDRGVRFAISTISRYLILVVGFVIAFGQIGIGWSKVQWLAAAMTVGLGFGLQEIFANFVSGLIILFERPMRVGDTVTAGDVTGTVTRIRIRATTITDWDRKELVVPNKEFITGRLVNWTLSDTILRIVFPVGIAYGSDTGLAEKLLLQVANEHPMVLEDPKPGVIFKAFGDSALEFELRVFIPDMESRWMVLHEVNRGIDDAFRKAGIEIAFPQRDIHLRSGQGPLPVELQPGEE